MQLDASFYKAEIRCDFLVTEQRKKIWAIELQILEEFDRVCRKHNLTWFADYGTLLGAVRHNGFIPWDDDIDVVMFRDDYMKLLTIATSEFKSPLFFQSAYTDSLALPFCHLRNSNTTAITFFDFENYNQGICIDIFPLDTVPSDNKSPLLEIQKELWLTIRNPSEITRILAENGSLLLDASLLKELLDMDISQRLLQFDLFNLQHFGETQYVNFIIDSICNISGGIKSEWFKETVNLPFEQFYVPAPICYEEILTKRYGNWQKWIQGASAHEGVFFDPDTPYTAYVNTPKPH